MKKILSARLALILVFVFCLARAESKEIRPADITPESYDPANGEFCVGLEKSGEPGEGFTLSLCLRDLYQAEEIRELNPGDVVIVSGQAFTVDRMVIHVEDIGGKEKNQMPVSYELIPREEDFSGYIAFIADGSDLWPVMINDCIPWTQVGSAPVPVPLPESFVYHAQSGADEVTGSARDFLSDLSEYFTPYNTRARFENGQLREIWHSDYPSDPEL